MRFIPRSLPAAATLLALAACAHGPRRPPDLGFGQDPNIETVAILGTNDFHGSMAPEELKTRELEGVASTAYKAGGSAAFASYVKVLRQEFGKALIWLDGGDEFQGSIESNLEQGAPMVRIFNELGLDAAAVGNHEFDYGPAKNPPGDPDDRLGALKARMKEARYPYLAANIANRATGKLADDLLPGLLPHKLIDTGRIKIGVIGLATLETPRTTLSTNIKPLVFTDLKDATMKEAAALRARGAQAVVIVSHVGIKCELGKSSAASRIRTPEEGQGECGRNGEMVKLLNSLPAGTVDAVVAGHSHQIVHHWVAGVPVIQGGAFGRYFNVVYLPFDVSTGKLLADRARIEGPVPICPAVFKNQNDCHGERPAPKGGRGPLVPYQFHGVSISEDSRVARLLETVYERSAEAKSEVIAHAARPVEHERFKESPLGSFAADAMRSVSGAEVSLMNAGGVRANWEAGPVTYGQVFRSFPFDNTVVKSRLSGKQLKALLRVAESGSRGFPSVSGVRLKLIDPESDAPVDDLNGDGKKEAWEANRILDLRLEGGEPIQDDRQYSFATVDFLYSGGDDLGWIMAQIPPERLDPPVMTLRDAVIQEMRTRGKNGPLNSVEVPLLVASDPRIQFEPPSRKKGGKKAKRRRAKR